MNKRYHNLMQPRSWFELFLRVGGWAVFVAGVVLLVLTYISVNTYIDAERLAQDGAHVDGTVTERRIRRDSEGSDDYFLTVAYTVQGRRFRDETKVSRSVYQSNPHGQTIGIRYWTKDPTLYELGRGQTKSKAQGLQIFALIAGLIACCALWFQGQKAAKGVLARRLGVRVTAELTGWVERKNSGKPTGKGYMVFVTEDGRRGESLEHPIRKFQAIGVGTRINVYVRGQDVWWEGDVGPRDLPTSSVPKVDG